METATCIYAYTDAFPTQEQYGLTSQMRRAAVSIPSNIAEGSRRRGKDAEQFLRIAYGSGSELETQLELSERLQFGNMPERQKCKDGIDEVMRMLNRMINTKSK